MLCRPGHVTCPSLSRFVGCKGDKLLWGSVMAVVRPQFNPSRCNATTDVDPLRFHSNDDVTWTPLVTCPADFPAVLVRSSTDAWPAVQLTSSISFSSNTPFLSSFIIRSTTRRSSFDLKSYKTLSRCSLTSFPPFKIYNPSGIYTASSSHVDPHATQLSSSTARSTRLQIPIWPMQNLCTQPCSCSRHSSPQTVSSHTTTQP